jgi:PadR family transcriptional regulator, regulatory protein PadR
MERHMMENLDKYELRLLKSWEEVYKKGQLTFWILIALKDGPKYMVDIKKFVADRTAQTFNVDDQSMYRALRRYYASELIEFTYAPGNNGPERKIYSLTGIGRNVLAAFSDRNIVGVFYNSSTQKLIEEK